MSLKNRQLSKLAEKTNTLFNSGLSIFKPPIGQYFSLQQIDRRVGLEAFGPSRFFLLSIDALACRPLAFFFSRPVDLASFGCFFLATHRQQVFFHRRRRDLQVFRCRGNLDGGRWTLPTRHRRLGAGRCRGDIDAGAQRSYGFVRDGMEFR
jgi:hypothetical protein